MSPASYPFDSVKLPRKLWGYKGEVSVNLQKAIVILIKAVTPIQLKPNVHGQLSQCFPKRIVMPHVVTWKTPTGGYVLR